MPRIKKSKIKSKPLLGVKAPVKSEESSTHKNLLDEYGTKAFTIIREVESVKPEHIGRHVKHMYSARADKFRIFAYVTREPFHRDYILASHESNAGSGATYSMALDECKLIPIKKKRNVKKGRKPKSK